MNTVRIAYRISKEAMKLVKAGKAVISSGGVRELNGRFIELAKPIANSIRQGGVISANPLFSGINLASSLGTNVQCGFIQKGVNTANLKLDTVMTKLDTLAAGLGNLSTIGALSWVNAGFGVANLCVSAVGFAMLSNKLDGIKNTIDQFYDRYKEDIENQKISQYRNLGTQLNSHLNILRQIQHDDTQQFSDYLSRESNIDRDLNDTLSFLNDIINDFYTNKMNGRIVCEIITTLFPLYCQVLNLSCCLYYYTHNSKQHPNYGSWCCIFDRFDSDEFAKALKRYFAFDSAYTDISPFDKAIAQKIIWECIEEQRSSLASCAESVTYISIERFTHLDEYINSQIMEALAPQIPALNGTRIEDYLDKCIKEYEPIEEDTADYIEIALPLESATA